MTQKSNLLGMNLEEELSAIRQYKEERKGLRTRTVSSPSNAAQIRHNIGLTQEAFAALLGVSVQTLRNWEQGTRKPNGSALALLRIIEKHPQVLYS